MSDDYDLEDYQTKPEDVRVGLSLKQRKQADEALQAKAKAGAAASMARRGLLPSIHGVIGFQSVVNGSEKPPWLQENESSVLRVRAAVSRLLSAHALPASLLSTDVTVVALNELAARAKANLHHDGHWLRERLKRR